MKGKFGIAVLPTEASLGGIVYLLTPLDTMNAHIDNAKKCLESNNALGMDKIKKPFEWNLHNATAALIKAFEEEIKALKEKVADLEQQIHRK